MEEKYRYIVRSMNDAEKKEMEEHNDMVRAYHGSNFVSPSIKVDRKDITTGIIETLDLDEIKGLRTKFNLMFPVQETEKDGNLTWKTVTVVNDDVKEKFRAHMKLSISQAEMSKILGLALDQGIGPSFIADCLTGCSKYDKAKVLAEYSANLHGKHAETGDILAASIELETAEKIMAKAEGKNK